MSLQLVTELKGRASVELVSPEDELRLHDACKRAIAGGGELGSIAQDILRINSDLDALANAAKEHLRGL